MIDFLIPGMSLDRSDIAVLIYNKKRGLSEEESSVKASALTDNQMQHIAEQFSDYFFLDNEGLFMRILNDAVEEVEDYDKEAD
jgi:hypothetical protein